MSDSPAAPPPPDYQGAAQAQGAANKETAIAQGHLNNPNIYSPYGQQEVTWSPPDAQGNVNPYVVQKLSPKEQAIYDQNAAVRTGLGGIAQTGIGNAGKVLGSQFNPAAAGVPGVQTGVSGGNIQQAPDLFSFGQAQGGPQSPELLRQLNLSGVSGMPQQGGIQNRIDTSGVAQAPINAGMTAQQAIMSRLEPALQRQRTSTETQLINQGLRPGGEAYDNAATLLGQQENDQRTQATLQGLNLDLAANQQGFGQAATQGQFANQGQAQGFGQGLAANQQGFGQAAAQGGFANDAALQGYGAGVTGAQLGNQAIGQNQQTGLNQQNAGNQAQLQGYNQALQSGQFGNTAQQQALAQALQQRQMPLNEISALMSGSQVQNPQFTPYNGNNVIGQTPIANAANQQAQYQQGLYNSQVGQFNSDQSNLYSLAGTAAMFALSDRRLKSNIKRVGTHPLGIGIYEYDIQGHRECGVMADELINVMPDAVATHPSGYLMVDYGKL